MRYELEMIDGRHLRMLVWDGEGHLADSLTIDAQMEGALRDLMSVPELYFAAVAKTPFESTLRRMQREVKFERRERRRQREQE